MSMRSRLVYVLILLVAALPMTGCWNSREPKQLAIVMALGIDKAPGNKYKVSFQIANSGQVAPGIVAGGSAYGAPVMVYSGTGSSIYEAIRKTSRSVPRQLFFAHIRLVVIGESLAKAGMQDIFDFFDRSRETRLTAMVLVARGGDAEQAVRTLTPMEKLPANAVLGKMTYSSRLWSENFTVYIDDVINMMVSEENVLLISGVKLAGDKEMSAKKKNVEQTNPPAILNISGMAVMQEGKFKKWLDGRLARGVIWARNKMESSVMTIDAMGKPKSVSIEVSRGKTKVKTQFTNGQLRFHFHIDAEGFITELQVPFDMTKPGGIDSMEKEWAETIREEVEAAIKQAQSDKCDMFGLGQMLRREHPKQWNKRKGDWNNVFADSEITVTVHTEIRHQGLRNKSYLSNISK